ncbi:MAG: universal stress protein [Vibrionaceae bacterium]|nr:universal stress protein [Vibrionaceae bacterium]
MYKQILVPVDLNDQGFSDRAVELAVWQAKQANAVIHLLTVVPGIHMSMVATYFPKDAALKMKQDVEQQLTAFAKDNIKEDVTYSIHVAEGKPYTTIIEHAKRLGIDLIIMPSHKRSKINKVMLGSVASKVVEYSPVNVMVVKPQS